MDQSQVTAGGNIIAGNYIGTDATGTAAISNCSGIYIWRVPNNTIGGTDPSARNVISGNSLYGVWLQVSDANVITGNYIGTDVTGMAAIPNQSGIYVLGAANNTIGGTDPGAGNIIAGNSGNAVYLNAFQARGGNAMRGNTIFGNGSLGIDLGGDGVTPNDDGDADTGREQSAKLPGTARRSRAPKPRFTARSTPGPTPHIRSISMPTRCPILPVMARGSGTWARPR